MRRRRKRIAILGWGSLLWYGGNDFDESHRRWRFDGPTLKIEFTRISISRLGALTLVIDADHGTPTPVAWCVSKRGSLQDVIGGLRNREGTSVGNIAHIERVGTQPADEPATTVAAWAKRMRLDAVVWTALPSNFRQRVGQPFSITAVVAYVKGLSPEGKAKAAEYVWRAPDFVKTPVRTALEQEPWFTSQLTRVAPDGRR